MSLRIPFIISFIAIAVAVSCLASLARAHRPRVSGPAADRKTLVVQGRTLDQDGFPIPRVRVMAAGSRRAQSKSDRSGEFSLSVGLRNVDDLEHERFVLVVWAQRDGWRFALPNGDENVGLELEVETVPGGEVRCVARSNDTRVAASAARAVGMQGTALGLAMINFVGVRGTATGPGPAPKLRQVAKAMLRGGSLALETPQEGTAAGPAPHVAPEETARAPRPDSIGPSVAAPTRADTSAQPGRVASPVREAPSRSAAVRAPAKAKSPIAKRPSPKSKDPHERAKAERLAREQALAQVRADMARPPSPEPEKRRTPPKRERESPSIRRDTVAAPRPVEDRSSDYGLRHGVAPDSSAGNGRVAGGQATGAQGTGAQTPAKRTPQSGPPPKPPVPVRPKGSSTAPPVIRGSGSRKGVAGLDSCRCRIEGTVEVNSKRPLPGRLLVVVSLEWIPSITDTVEMLTRSPQRFELPPVPCGPQRIKVSPVARERYAVVSRRAMIGFDCAAGEHREYRIVLAPE